MIQDHFQYGAEIIKATKEENGDWVIEGIASSGGKDLEGENIVTRGLDYSYFLNKGFIKWEHEKNPKNYIGEPVEAKIVKDGFYVKGRLYGHAPLAQEVVQALTVLEKSNAKRKIGFSVEGTVKERDRNNPKKILKAVVRNVALTFNPVKDDTFARLVKSFNGEEEMEKAMDTSSGSALRQESLESEANFKFALIKFLKALLEESEVDMEEVTKALSLEEADEFKTYVKTNKNLLESIVIKISGGENMGKVAKTLDMTLDELQKSLGIEETKDVEAEDEIIKEEEENKTLKKKKLNKKLTVTKVTKNKKEEDDEEYEDEDDEEEYKDDEDDEEYEDDDEDEDEDSKKSFKDDFLGQDEIIEKALEVSEFLEILVDTIGTKIDGFTKQSDLLGRTLFATGKLIKSMNAKLEEQDEFIKSLQDSIDEISNQPIGRKSIINAREVTTISKSLEKNNEIKKQLTKGQIVDLLVKSVEKGEIEPLDVTRYETSGFLSKEIAKIIGLGV